MNDEEFDENKTTYINKFQEHLQQLAPGLGANAQFMYEFEETSLSQTAFIVRIRLLSTVEHYQGNHEMPISNTFRKKKPAKQHAAFLAYKYLQRNRLRPHDPTVTIAQQYISSGNGNRNDDDDENNNGGISTVFSQPIPDFNDYLDVEPNCYQFKNENESDDNILESESESENESFDDGDDDSRSNSTTNTTTTTNTNTNTTTSFIASINNNRLPQFDIGKLGEEYAFQWLQKQVWINSATWMNENKEAGYCYDIHCTPIMYPGRSYVEVKTIWKGFKRVRISRAQMEALKELKEDYMVLQIGNFGNLFMSPPKSPEIKIFVYNNNNNNENKNKNKNKFIMPVDDPIEIFHHDEPLSSSSSPKTIINFRGSVKVKSEWVGYVIGKGGETIRRIQDETQTSISKYKSQDYPENEYLNFRINSKGYDFDSLNIQQAKQKIFQSIPIYVKRPFTSTHYFSKLFIGNISASTTANDLSAFFSSSCSIGVIIDCWVQNLNDKNDRRRKNKRDVSDEKMTCGYIVFENENDYSKGLEMDKKNFNGYNIHVIYQKYKQ